MLVKLKWEIGHLQFLVGDALSKAHLCREDKDKDP